MAHGRRFRRRRGRRECVENSLYHAEVNRTYIVGAVPNANLLHCLGVFPNSLIEKEYVYRMGGPVIVKIGNRKVAIGKDLASRISVSEVD